MFTLPACRALQLVGAELSWSRSAALSIGEEGLRQVVPGLQPLLRRHRLTPERCRCHLSGTGRVAADAIDAEVRVTLSGQSTRSPIGLWRGGRGRWQSGSNAVTDVTGNRAELTGASASVIATDAAGAESGLALRAGNARGPPILLSDGQRRGYPRNAGIPEPLDVGMRKVVGCQEGCQTGGCHYKDSHVVPSQVGPSRYSLSTPSASRISPATALATKHITAPTMRRTSVTRRCRPHSLGLDNGLALRQPSAHPSRAEVTARTTVATVNPLRPSSARPRA